MYKLLATTAIIVATASPSLAWDGAKDIIQDLNTIYTSVGGNTQFGVLSTTGELNTFIETVNQGVTHVTLTVEDNKTITAAASSGVTLQEIIDSSDDLINRVSFDLFEDDGNGYQAGTDYSNIAPALGDAVGENGSVNYSNGNANGLVGARITSICSRY